MEETGHPSGRGASHGTSSSSDPEMEPRVPAGSARDQHAPTQAQICHRFPELQSQAGAGIHSRDAPFAPGAARGREPGNGPVPERPTGAGETKRNPRGTSSPPSPCSSRRQLPLRGPFASRRAPELFLTRRGRARLQGEGLWRELWEDGDLGTGDGGGWRGGELGGNRGALACAGQSGASPVGPVLPPSQRPTPGGVGRGGRPRLDVRRRVYKGGGRRGDPQRRSRAAAEPPAPPAAACRARPAGEMLSCRLQCALALLSIALVLGTASAAPSDPRLRQFLQKSLAAAAGKQVREPRDGAGTAGTPGHPPGTPTAALRAPASTETPIPLCRTPAP